MGYPSRHATGARSGHMCAYASAGCVGTWLRVGRNLDGKEQCVVYGAARLVFLLEHTLGRLFVGANARCLPPAKVARRIGLVKLEPMVLIPSYTPMRASAMCTPACMYMCMCVCMCVRMCMCTSAPSSSRPAQNMTKSPAPSPACNACQPHPNRCAIPA